MMKTSTIDSFFKRKSIETSEQDSHIQSEEHRAPKVKRLQIADEFDITQLERDPEYSKEVDAIFCLPCFLFQKDDGPSGSNAFTIDGFRTWNKVTGKNCSLMAHVGKDHNSPHYKVVMSWSDLLNQPAHIPNRFGNFKTQEILDNRLRLKTSIEAATWLAYQSCAFRGHDESDTSKNCGNFMELLRYSASLNSDVAKVLDNAPRNASYTSPKIQKQILQVLAMKVKKYIREEIGCAKFCIIVDEARDESKREQMTLVLRFVDRDG
ncbi:hypothetical protein QQ045_023157 [Rhodiola kirilowii]